MRSSLRIWYRQHQAFGSLGHLVASAKGGDLQHEVDEPCKGTEVDLYNNMLKLVLEMSWCQVCMH